MPAKFVSNPFEPHWPATIPVWSRAVGSWNFSVSRRPFQPSELELHYDKSANGWQSKVERLGFVDAYHKLLASAFKQVDMPESGSSIQVMDAGIGTGAMSVALSELVPCNVELLGVDLSSKMLDQAKTKIQNPRTNLKTLKADLSALPLQDSVFDVVLVAHVVEHLADPVAVLNELHRVLKPGGIMIACITRRSLFGRYIQLIWRTHQVSSKMALDWMKRARFETARTLPLDKLSGTRNRSIGYLARKAPMEQS